MSTDQSPAARTRAAANARRLGVVLSTLEVMQQRVGDVADNADINHAKDILMRLLSRWERS